MFTHYLHNKLTNRYSWYQKYHQWEHHHKVHWAVLAMYVFSVVSFGYTLLQETSMVLAVDQKIDMKAIFDADNSRVIASQSSGSRGNAIDNDISSTWRYDEPGNPPIPPKYVEWKINLYQNYNISKFRYYVSTGVGAYISTSTDDISYNNRVTSISAQASWQEQTFSPIDAQYIKFYITLSGPVQSISLNEIEAYGTASDPPPTISIGSPSNNCAGGKHYTRSSSVTVSGTAADTAPGTVSSVTVNGGAATGTTSWSKSGVSLPSEGDNTITAIATDNSSQTGSASMTVYKDTTAPTVTISSPAEGTVTSTSTATISGSAYDNSGGSGLSSVSSSTGSSVSGTSSWSTTVNLSAGSNTITITATDCAGNTGTRSVGIVYQSGTVGDDPDTPPDVTDCTELRVTSPNGGEIYKVGTSSGQVTSTNITWSVGDCPTDRVNLSYSTNNSTYTTIATNEDNDGSYSWTLPSISSNTVKVKVQDADNSSYGDTSDDYFSISSSSGGDPGYIGLDGTGGDITTIGIGGIVTQKSSVTLTGIISNSKVTLTWNNPPGTIHSKLYRFTSPNGTISDSALITTLNKTGLTSTYDDTTVVNETIYYYKAVAYSLPTKVLAISNEITATPSANIDTTPPPNPDNITAKFDDRQCINLTWTDPVTDKLNYIAIYRSLTKDKGSEIDREIKGVQLFNDCTITPGETYYYILSSTNQAGISSSGTTPVKVITKAPSKTNQIITTPISSPNSPIFPSTLMSLISLAYIAKPLLTFIKFFQPTSTLNPPTTLNQTGSALTSPLGWKQTKKHPWGTVIDAYTRLPIQGISLSVIDVISGRSIDKTITDAYGRFALHLNRPGNYQVNATGVNYQSVRTYPMSIDSPQSVPISLLLALTPVIYKEKPQYISHQLISSIDSFLTKARIPIIIIGTIWTGFVLITTPTILAYLTALIYAIIWTFELLRLTLPNPIGSVIDAQDNKPLDRAIVRLNKVDSNGQTLVGTQVTGQTGSYMFLLPPGSYVISTIRLGYQEKIKQPIQNLTKPTHTKDKIEMVRMGGR